MKLIFVLSTIYIILILINYLVLGKENDISKIFKDFNALSKNKKIIFITSFFIFWPFYTLAYTLKLFFVVQIFFIGILCLYLKIKIEKKWNSCNYSYCNFKINKLTTIILIDGFINSYNSAFTSIYSIFSYKKKRKTIKVF
jgi:hypothetical protein